MRRDDGEIIELLSEAIDKTWLIRSNPVENPEIERLRVAAVNDILRKYKDIPRELYNDWECGYWNGVADTLRWVLNDELGDIDAVLGRDETMDGHDRTPG